MKPRVDKRFRTQAVIILGVALAYIAAGKFGLSLASVNPSATAVWPPTGLALAACLLLGGWVWPGILLGAFLVNVSTSGQVPASLTIAAGNTLEGVLGAYLVRRYAGGAQAFERAHDVLAFATLAGMLSTAVSATIGTTSLMWSGQAAGADFWPIWLTWWLGDATGAMIVAPFLIVWARPPWLPRARAWEAAALLLGLLGVAYLVFGGWHVLSAESYPVSYVVLPLVAWAAFRFGPPGAVTATLVLSGIALGGTLQGFGPFDRGSPNQSLLLLQGFMGVVATTGLGLASVMAGANRAFEAARAARQAAEQTADRLQRLQAVTEALSRLQPAAQLADTVIAHMLEVLSASAGSVVLLTEDGQALEVVQASGYPPAVLSAFRRFPLAASVPLADAARTGQPVWLESAKDWRSSYPNLAQQQSVTGNQAAAAVPILSGGGRPIGALGLSFASPRTLTPEEQDFILTLARQIGQALDRGQLYQAAQALNQELDQRVRQQTA
jgi:integral membrane sensor domain MASE1